MRSDPAKSRPMDDDEGDRILRIAYFAGIAIVMLLVAILLLFWREWLEALVALLISALALGFTLYHHRED
jgi:hypothetical protein